MQDTNLYEYLLNLKSPWTIRTVNLDVKEQQVDVWAVHPEGISWECPECGKNLPLYDHVEERAWRHLDSCQFKTILHARIPRVECQEHGVKQAKVPWSESKSRFTLLFERMTIDVLKQCGVTGATKIMRISWDEAWLIMKHAVERGQARKVKEVVPVIGVDEKAITKGHHYLTLVYNLMRGTVEYIAEDRKTESLKNYYQALSKEQLDGIEAVAMDMWEPYMQATLACVPDAKGKIVFDRFHVMGYVGKAVDKVRKEEHRERMKKGDKTLKGSKYLWLYNPENIPDSRRSEFEGLRHLELKVGRAWAIKETLRRLWHFVYPASGWKFWKKWYFWATHSQLKPMKEAAETLKRHIQNIVTYFQHQITNAMSEGINGKIQRIKKMANGFRNVENFKTAIFFHCGGLDLYPH
jgi:transposase